ncbi:hypothetical protein ABBQ32_009498 [Trebouxia sp. C0010 RCD-2024]
MLKLLCHSLVLPSRANTLTAQSGLLHRAARRMSASDRSYPAEPRVGVGVVILRPASQQTKDTEVLLIKRGKAPSKGLWSFPGGSQELGETLVECALRESQEETGLTLRNDSALAVAQGGSAFSKTLQVPTPFAAADVISYDNTNQVEYHYTIVEVAAVPDDPTAVPEAASDVVDIRWVPITSLRQQKDLVVNAARIAEEAAERFEVHT